MPRLQAQEDKLIEESLRSTCKVKNKSLMNLEGRGWGKKVMKDTEWYGLLPVFMTMTFIYGHWSTRKPELLGSFFHKIFI